MQNRPEAWRPSATSNSCSGRRREFWKCASARDAKQHAGLPTPLKPYQQWASLMSGPQPCSTLFECGPEVVSLDGKSRDSRRKALYISHRVITLIVVFAGLKPRMSGSIREQDSRQISHLSPTSYFPPTVSQAFAHGWSERPPAPARRAQERDGAWRRSELAKNKWCFLYAYFNPEIIQHKHFLQIRFRRRTARIFSQDRFGRRGRHAPSTPGRHACGRPGPGPRHWDTP